MLQAVTENSHALLAYLDPLANFLYVNNCYAAGSGYTREQLLGRNHFLLFPSEEDEAIFRRVVETGKPARFLTKPFRYAGDPVRGLTQCDGSLAPVKDAAGRVQGLVLTLLDVSEQQRAAEQREEHQARLVRELQQVAAEVKLANVELREALDASRQRQAEIAALLQGSRAVLQHRDFASAARAIHDACKNLLGAEGGYVALLSEDGTRNELAYLDAGGHPCAVDPALPMPVRGLRAEAYRLGEAVYDNDSQHSEWVRFLPPGHTDLQNVLLVPLVLEGKALGLLGLSNKAGGFGENDARLAAASAELATIALRNSRVLDSLTESEGRIRSVAQTAHDAIIAVDGRGVIALWNSAAETIFGYASEEIIGQPLTRIMPADLRRWHDRAFDEGTLCSALPHRGRTMEATGLRKDGHVFPIEISLSAWMAGSRPFYTAIIRDITERTRTEEVLRESEQRFCTLYETMSQGVVHQDAEGRIISANPAAQRILGMTLDELQGRASADPQWRNIHEDGSDFPGEEHLIVVARKTGAPVRDVVMGAYFLRDGQYHWMKADAVPQFRPGEERPYQVYAVFEDISECKRAEQEIESLARFPAVNPSPVLRIHRTGVVLYANRAGKGLLDDWQREPHSDGPAYWRALVVSALDGRAARSVDTHCGGHVWSLAVVPVMDGGYANLYALDITRRVQAAEALRRARDELESRVEERTAQLAAVNAISAAAASSLHLGEVLAALKNGAVGYVLKDSCADELVQAVRQARTDRYYLSSPLSERAIASYVQRAKKASLEPYDTLTTREREVLQLAAEGYTSAEIASRLFISARTVETHRANLMRKLGLTNQIDIVRYALRRGILSLDS